MHTVTKRIDFCYGHRLLNYAGPCKNLHGHNGLLEVDVRAESLDARGMVVDFSDIRSIAKGWVDAHLDHKMVLNEADPLLPVLEQMGEPHYVMDANPTAENIARLVYEQVRAAGLDVAEVRLWETPSSFAAYREA